MMTKTRSREDRISGADRVLDGLLFALFVFLYFFIFNKYSLVGFTREPGDFVFNDMFLRLLSGDFAIDRSVIGDEAYVRAGRTYAYFGIVPALARIVFWPFLDLRTTSVSSIVCTVLAFVTSCVNFATLQLSQGFPKQRALRQGLLFCTFFAGLPFYLVARHSTYVESALWALMFAAIYIHVFVKGFAGAQATGRGLWLLAALAGLCLNTRVTTGLTLSLGVSALVLSRVWEGGKPPRMREAAPALRTSLVACAVLSLFLMLAFFVNDRRWGNFLEFADLKRQTFQIHAHPERLTILLKYGLFNPDRLAFGLQYYFLPVWGLFGPDGHSVLNPFMLQQMHGAEFPPSSFFLTDAVYVWMIGLWLLGVIRRGGAAPVEAGRRESAGSLGQIVAFAPVPLLMLTHIYMALRYRIEFFPLLFFAAWLAFDRLGSDAFWRRRQWVALALVAVSVLASVLTLWLGYIAMGPTTELNFPHAYQHALSLLSPGGA